MKINPLPDINYLKECFEIDNSVPQGLRWILQRPQSHFKTVETHKRWTTLYAGKACGTIHRKRETTRKYYITELSGRSFFNHRIIYGIHHGVTDFEKAIDHIDGNVQNNDIKNLRLVTASENKLNSKIHKNNKSGHKNIYFREKYKSYNCGITINGKQKHIGSYNTLEEALKARNSYIEHLKETIGDYFRI